jgi:Uncharacterized conserved protein
MIIADIVSSFIGTIGFSILYNIPKKYYMGCGITGMLGWVFYLFIERFLSPTISTFFATILVVLMARMLAVWLKCPITIFLVPGIFPLLPGANVYYTAYYLVVEELRQAAEYGMNAMKLAFAIVLGIVLIFSIPREVFQITYWRKRRASRV